MKVFVHIDAFGTYIGNGGFLLLTDLANRLADMGYDVSVFDAQNRLKKEHFEWLSLREVKFKIANTWQIFGRSLRNFRIVSAWLKALPPFMRKNLRYLESSELIREGSEATRQYAIDNNVKTVNLHPNLKPFYEKLGLTKMTYIPAWVDNRAQNCEEKIANSVGIQLERKTGFLRRKHYDVKPYRILYDKFKKNIIRCNGPYATVLNLMKQADFYVHYPKPSPHIKLFQGETLGRPLFEAMASGCVCIARKHEGINFLQGVIPLVSSMNQAVNVLRYLMKSEDVKEKVRQRSLALIEKNHRFCEVHEKAIREWLE